MKNIFKSLIIIIIGLWVLYLVTKPTVGNGSLEGAHKWVRILSEENDIDELKKLNPHFEKFDFSDGDWIIALAQNSHGNKNGGNLITLDNSNNIKIYMGHVCGNTYFSYFTKNEPKNLNELYQSLKKILNETELSKQ